MCTKQVLLSPRACVYTCVWVCVLSNPNVWATGCYINGLMTLPCQKEDMCSTPPYWWMDRTVGELRETDWFMGPFKGNLLSVSLPLHRCKCWWPTWTSDFKDVKDRRAADTGSQWFFFFFFLALIRTQFTATLQQVLFQFLLKTQTRLPHEPRPRVVFPLLRFPIHVFPISGVPLALWLHTHTYTYTYTGSQPNGCSLKTGTWGEAIVWESEIACHIRLAV